MFDVDSDIVSGVALVLNVSTQSLDFSDGLLELRVIVPNENSVVNIYHENDVSAEIDTVIISQRLESNRRKLVYLL